MNIGRTLILSALFCSTAGLSACDGGSPLSNGTHSVLGDTVANAMDAARRKLRTENIDISSGHVGFSAGHGNERNHAEITPQGDLLIDGKTVTVTPQQRAMLLEYRAQVIDIAEQGMQVGTQGVDLASHAVGTALSAAFSGKSHQQVHAEIETEAEGIRHSAAKLCARLPALRDTQQQLAASLPAFAPYATMTQADIDECTKNAEQGHYDAGDIHADR